MKKATLVLILLLGFNRFGCFAQNHTVSGFIVSSKTGERLISATVYDSISKTGMATNMDGFFSLKLPAGEVKIKASYVGYKSYATILKLERDTFLTFRLQEESVVAGAVEISASVPIHKQVLMGLTNVPIKTIEAVPSFTGQPDLLKAITYIPGFSGGKEGYSNIMVRGGDRGQNLILLDGIKLYNTNHLGGFVSLFNTDVVKQVDMYKGGFPARYGGRTASVINVVTRDGNNEKLHGKFSLGLISSSLSIDGPIGEKITYMMSARTSYFDLFLLPGKISTEKSKHGSYMGYNFYDLNGKLTFRPNDRSKWSLNCYQGSDRMKSVDYFKPNGIFEDLTSTLNILNRIVSLTNDRYLSHKLYLRSNISYTGYTNRYKDYRITTDNSKSTIIDKGFSSSIRELSAQSKLEWYLSDRQTLMGGIEFSNYSFSPMVQYSKTLNDNTGFKADTTMGYTEPMHSNELSLFVEDDIKLTGSTFLNIGLRGVEYLCDSANYFAIEPRVSLRTMVNENLSIKANYTMMHQFNHVIINNVSGMEREIWLASSPDIPGQVASQWSAGLFGSIPEKHLEMSVELYYKTMSNLLEYRFPPNNYINLKQLKDLIIKNGKGEAYGAEFQVKYSTDRFTADLGYTLSWNYRQFDSLNNGNRYPFLYDRRHNLSLFTQLKLSKRYLLSSNFLFSTGTPVTFPEAWVKTDDYALGYYVYSGINNRRLPNYHRLDVALTRKNKTKRGNNSQWCLNIFNVYAHQNPVIIYYQSGKVYQKSLFSIIPTISYSFEF